MVLQVVNLFFLCENLRPYAKSPGIVVEVEFTHGLSQSKLCHVSIDLIQSLNSRGRTVNR